MKKRTLLILSLVLSISLIKAQSSFEIIKSDHESIWIKVSPTQLQKKVHHNGKEEIFSLMIKDGVSNLEKGTPDLPFLYTSLEIPEGLYSVEIISAKEQTIENIKIAPSKGNLLRNVDPKNIPFEYGPEYDDKEYPTSKAGFSKAFIFGNLRGQTLKVQPFSYDPSQQILTFFTEMILKVSMQDGGSEDVIELSNKSINQSFHQIYKKKFLNYKESVSRYDLVPDLGNLLVIAPEYLHGSVEELIVWRQQMGIATELVDMESIGTTGDDLKGFIDNYYSTNGLTFLLLIGDIDQIPTLPTGNNNACDHCFSYQSGDDHFPEFFTGRIPASDSEDVSRIIQKILIYEKTPNVENSNWFSTGLGMGSAEGPGDDGEYDYEHLNIIKSNLLNYGYTSVFEFYDGDQSQKSPTLGDVSADKPGNPPSSSIRDVIDNGASLLNYTGHGAHQVLSSGSLDVGDLNMLVNSGAYPFAIAVACCVGDFKDDFGDGDCFGEAWMKASNEDGSPTGGIGGCFSTILQSWSPPMEGQDEMNKLITESTSNQIRHTIGSIIVHGCSAMIEAYGGGGENMMDSWSIFGDPSVVLRTSFPTVITATHLPVIPLGSTSLAVHSETENALVGLYYDGSLLGSGIIEGGQAIIEFPVLDNPEAILVTLTGYNKLPYQGQVEVSANNGPFIVIDNYQIDDSEGNGNNAADYGEFIRLDVSLENVGGLDANIVSATISTTQSAVELIDIESEWGTINQQESKMLAAAFSFKIDDLIDDKMLIPFLISITDINGNSWIGNLNVVANAPIVSVLNIEMNDKDTGNGNNRIDAGETVRFIITQSNTGNAATNNEIGTLSCINTYLSIINPVNEIGIMSDAGTEITSVFEVDINTNVPHGEEAYFNYEVTDGLYGSQSTFTFPMNLIVEDFESEDFEQFPWTTVWEEDVNWFVTDLMPFEGKYCAQSGAIEKNQSTTLRMDLDVFEEGEISFTYRTESEDNYDFLEFYINDVLKGSWSGNQVWQEANFSISQGVQRIEWKYVKDGLINAYSDAVWIDNIKLPEHDAIISEISNLDEKNSVKIYPNPASNQLVIDVPGQSLNMDEIILTDTNGKMSIFSPFASFAGTSVVLDICHLNPGIYFVSVFDGKQWQTNRFVIQR